MDGIMDDVNENDTSETIVVDDMPLDDLNSDDKSYPNDAESIETNIAPNVDSFDVVVESKCPEKKMEKVIQLPLTRVKNLMKLDPDVHIASQDAVIAVTKAAELFIHMLGKEAYKFTKQNKKKTIQKKDINDCIASCEALAFLEEGKPTGRRRRLVRNIDHIYTPMECHLIVNEPV